MKLDIRTDVKPDGKVTHIYQSGPFTWRWNLKYPTRVKDDLSTHITGLAYAPHFFYDSDPVIVTTDRSLTDQLKEALVSMWTYRAYSAGRFVRSASPARSVNLLCQSRDASPSRSISKNLHAVMFSYGKESVLTRSLIQEATGELPLSFTYKTYGKNLPCVVRRQMVVESDFEQYKQGKWWDAEFTQMIFAPLIDAMGVTDIHVGSEYESTIESQVYGYVTPTSYQQDEMFDAYASLFLSYAGDRHVNSYSILRAIPEALVLRIMMHHFNYDFASLVRSCWKTKQTKPWCGKCPKCHRIGELFRQIGMACPYPVCINRPKDASKSIYSDDPQDKEIYRRSLCAGTSLQPEGLGVILSEQIRKVVEHYALLQTK